MYIRLTQYNIWGIITYGDKGNTLQLNVRASYKIAKDVWDAIQITYEDPDIAMDNKGQVINRLPIFNGQDYDY
ncbi:hypothetical protein CR513_23056, partial [Mucuna pruriens]